MTESTAPQAIDPAAAKALKLEFCKALGFDANTVQRIDFSATTIDVYVKGRIVHSLNAHIDSWGWKTKYPPSYGHAANL